MGKKISEEEPYSYARFTWWHAYNIEELANKLKDRFNLVKPPSDKKNRAEDLSLLRDAREEIEVKADTLFARLSAFRAILFQKEKAPFTSKDMELRETVFALYQRSTATPILGPYGFKEPKFEKQPSQEEC